VLTFSGRWRVTQIRTGILRLASSALRPNSFLRRAGVLSGGSALGHLFTLAISPLLTRLYGPSDFGTLGLFTSYLAVAGCAVALQYETSIVSATNDRDATYLMLAATLLTIPTSVLAGGTLWILIRFSLLGFGGLNWYAPVCLSFVMCFVGIFVSLRYWNLRKHEFREVSRAVVTQSAARAFIQAAAGALHLHDAGLIFGETLGRGVGMGRMFTKVLPDLRVFASQFEWSECRRVLWRNRKFPFLSLPSSLMDALCVSLALPMLIHLYGAASGGYYSLVWRAIALPSVLITLAVADTFHSQAAFFARERPHDILGLFARTSLTLLLIGLIPFTIFICWGQPLFRTIFGSQWATSGAIAALIAPWYLAQFVTNPVSRVVLVLNGQETKLAWDALCILSIPAVFYVARVTQMEVLHTIRLLSLVNTALYVAYFLVLLRVIAHSTTKSVLAGVGNS
jgi:lipopolysaccharide exporter